MVDTPTMEAEHDRTIAEMIAEHIARPNGPTQTALASRLGVSQATVSRWL